MNGKRFFAGLAAAAMASAAIAMPSAKAPACAITVKSAWIRQAPPKAGQLAGYAILKNRCPKAVTISDVSSRDFGMAMIHGTVVENGISKMRHVGALTIPAQGRVVFTPAGGHLMLMMPVRELKAGDKVKLTFATTDGKKIDAEFAVLRDAPAIGK